MVRVEISLTQREIGALRRAAEKTGKTLAALVRGAIKERLAADRKPHSARVQSAIAATGRFKSGRGDVSVRHDDYFVDALWDPTDSRRRVGEIGS